MAEDLAVGLDGGGGTDVNLTPENLTPEGRRKLQRHFEKLRTATQEASPGPWRYAKTPSSNLWIVGNPEQPIAVMADMLDQQAYADARFISAWDPLTALQWLSLGEMILLGMDEEEARG
jgi:hypothetical protein